MPSPALLNPHGKEAACVALLLPADRAAAWRNLLGPCTGGGLPLATGAIRKRGKEMAHAGASSLPVDGIIA